jgi:GGDEF domain-containing protein
VVAAVVVLGVLVALACAVALQHRSPRRPDAHGPVRGSRSFDADLEREVARSTRSGQPGCLVLLRLEREEAGRTLTSVMACELRVMDLRYRLGAGEFALILPDTRARGGLIAAGRIEESLLLSTGAAGFAAGVAELGPGIDGEQLLRNAQSALAVAGRHGHSTVLEYSPLLHDEIEPGPAARSHR